MSNPLTSEGYLETLRLRRLDELADMKRMKELREWFRNREVAKCTCQFCGATWPASYTHYCHICPTGEP